MLLHDLLRTSAARFPDKAACVCEGQRWTYTHLEEASNRLAHGLADAGIGPGDRVAVWLDNSIESVLSVFAILKAGAAFVMLNPTLKAPKLCYLLKDCAASAVILRGRAGAVIEVIEREVDSVRFFLCCGPKAAEEQAGAKPRFAFESYVGSFPATAPPRSAIDLDIAALVYTSGSTGQPKGVIATHQSMGSAVASIAAYLGNVPEDVILNPLPLSFTYGLSQLTTAARVGATVVLERSFAYPYQLVQRVAAEQVTGFPGVPTIFATLLQMKDIDPGLLDSVRYVTSAGAALPPAHVERLPGLFRNAEIFNMYGQTECVRVTYLSGEALRQRPGSVGRGMPNQQLSLMDAAGNPVAPGETGELVVRGAHVMKGYWNLPEKTEAKLRPGRYPWERELHTGDLFRVDEAGYLYFVSRQDDIIKTRGEKVSPIEVENCIAELASVQDVGVTGVPDPILGEAIKAVVVAAEGAAVTEKAIIGHCRSRLENFMVPKIVEFRASLPKVPSGKLIRKALIEDGAANPERNGT